MPLSAGDKLGPYEILALVGKGGMGEVYRAHDSRLNRDVAIKVSNAQFTERFTREARTIASLNHTNICHLYDVVIEKDGPNYLVMEYVEGPDLRGPMDFDDALPIIQQVIDGIEAAHEKNIIHRDLKPANIKITPEGVVKILDFGLAKAMEPPPSSDGNHENSPTLTMGATATGTILGTAAYMAPEQAKGKAADKRSDIWSFGVVLYEMLTGKRLFTGETAVEILGAVLNQDPDISAAPPRVHKLLRWCLEKDRKQRLASISDVRRLLSESAETASTMQLAPPPPSRLGKLPWIAAAVLAVGFAASSWIAFRATRPAELKPMVRLDVDLGSEISLATPNGSSNVILSPDGTRLVYVASVAGGDPSLFIRRFDQPRGTELPGTENPQSPFFSPDGQWVGFTANGKLGKISVEGGAVVPLQNDAPNSNGASWGEDGNIVQALLLRGLFRIPAAGGNPAPVLEVANGEIALAAPQILPGGKAVLFAAYSSVLIPDTDTVDVLTLADHRRKSVVRGGVAARYLPASSGAGYLLYVNKATMFAVPFDLDKLETRGTALPVLDDVGYNSTTFESQFDVSRNGTLVYRKAGGAAAAQLTSIQWLDAAGKHQPLVAKPALYTAARLSPDGKRLAAAVGEGGDESIQVYDLQRETWSKLTFDHDHFYFTPVWSPDGRYVVFGSLGGLLWARADGSGQPQPLTRGQNIHYPGSISPDGKRVAYWDVGRQSNSGTQIWTVPVEENGAGLKAGATQLFLKSQFGDVQPAFSPDGRWLAYESHESNKVGVYVRAFPDNGGRWKISTDGATAPVWSRSAHELLYQAGDQIMAVGYSVKGDAFVPERSRVWAAKAGGRLADLSQDGKHAVILSPVAAPETPTADHEVVLVQNFLDELRRKVRAGK